MGMEKVDWDKSGSEGDSAETQGENSGGMGARKVIRLPVDGCVKARRRAWSMSRPGFAFCLAGWA